ncbi:hypothetical protein [Acanthopleuribacter pedis]|uniref:Uncharacterized protein n=1 Tax=Acanthopleuribacter pedis TaxID=442870 RepID=A0A8J7Q6C9_9BACT|nr:hypothetical protein [Acanthopleuribacter pedis]MBO1318931.1 hypothetical protein [Acanthopleuribacter pedis]
MPGSQAGAAADRSNVYPYLYLMNESFPAEPESDKKENQARPFAAFPPSPRNRTNHKTFSQDIDITHYVNSKSRSQMLYDYVHKRIYLNRHQKESIIIENLKTKIISFISVFLITPLIISCNQEPLAIRFINNTKESILITKVDKIHLPGNSVALNPGQRRIYADAIFTPPKEINIQWIANNAKNTETITINQKNNSQIVLSICVDENNVTAQWE